MSAQMPLPNKRFKNKTKKIMNFYFVVLCMENKRKTLLCSHTLAYNSKFEDQIQWMYIDFLGDLLCSITVFEPSQPPHPNSMSLHPPTPKTTAYLPILLHALKGGEATSTTTVAKEECSKPKIKKYHIGLAAKVRDTKFGGMRNISLTS